MSHYLVELYTPNAAWLALTATQRADFLAAIGQALGGLSTLGVEILTLGVTDQAVDQATTHTFVGIWRFPDIAARDALLQGIQASGWYDYFNHVNAAAEATDFAAHQTALCLA